MRALLTRPLDDSERSAARLRDIGWDSLIAPVLEIAELPTNAIAANGSAQLDEGRFDGALATSARAFGRFGARPETGIKIPLWTVGARTADAASARGWTQIRLVAENAEALAVALAAEPLGGSWLYLAGTPRRAFLAAAMHAQNRRLTVVETYETRAAPHFPERAAEALRAGALDAVLHYSPRSAAIFTELTRLDGLETNARDLVHIAISPRAAEALRDFPRVRVARRPTEADMFDALGAHTA